MSGDDAAGGRRVGARRLLVALDASPPSLAALDAAAALAARLGAEIEGLYVEDADFARLAALPVGRIVDAVSAAARTPEAAEFEAAFRALAARARERLAEAAARERVTWSFRVVRGRVATEVLAASESADLVCVGATSGTAAGSGRLGRTACAVASRARGAVAVIPGDVGLAGPFVVVHDGTDAGRRALAIAASLAGPHDRVAVVVPAGDGDGRERAARDAADAFGPSATVTDLPGTTAVALARAVRAHGGRTLVLPVAACGDVADTLPRIVAEARCAVVAVSTETGERISQVSPTGPGRVWPSDRTARPSAR